MAYLGVELQQLYEVDSYGVAEGYGKTVCNPDTIQVFASLDEAKNWIREQSLEGERAVYDTDTFPHRIM